MTQRDSEEEADVAGWAVQVPLSVVMPVPHEERVWDSALHGLQRLLEAFLYSSSSEFPGAKWA